MRCSGFCGPTAGWGRRGQTTSGCFPSERLHCTARRAGLGHIGRSERKDREQPSPESLCVGFGADASQRCRLFMRQAGYLPPQCLFMCASHPCLRVFSLPLRAHRGRKKPQRSQLSSSLPVCTCFRAPVGGSGASPCDAVSVVRARLLQPLFTSVQKRRFSLVLPITSAQAPNNRRQEHRFPRRSKSGYVAVGTNELRNIFHRPLRVVCVSVLLG